MADKTARQAADERGFTQIGEKRKREVINAFPLYYDERSSNILTRIYVLAKTK
jgi:hypothetical protein